jgi:ABC-2 type transporter
MQKYKTMTPLHCLCATHSRYTTINSLHQPRQEVFDMLGRVLLLSAGQVAYFGPPQGVAAYFSAVGRPLASDVLNPADALLDLCTGNSRAELPRLYARQQAQLQAQARRRAAQSAGVWFAAASSTSTSTTAGTTAGATAAGAAAVASHHGFTTDSYTEDTEPDVWKQQCCGAHANSSSSSSSSASSEAVTGWQQFCVLSTRLLRQSYRHPLLLGLHFCGTAAMALLLGAVFGGKLAMDLAGAQRLVHNFL